MSKPLVLRIHHQAPYSPPARTCVVPSTHSGSRDALPVDGAFVEVQLAEPGEVAGCHPDFHPADVEVLGVAVPALSLDA
jgi:hypothetical protein